MVKKRKAVSKKPSRSFFQEYNFEITVILLLGFGVFLLVEDLEIKHYIATFIRSVLFGIINVFEAFRDKIIHTVRKGVADSRIINYEVIKIGEEIE